MVVSTRSSSTIVSSAPAPAHAPPAHAPPASRRAPRRSARLSTPSYLESSVRSYKIYTPSYRPVRGYDSDADATAAAETLVSIHNEDCYDDEFVSPIPASFRTGSCINPTSPVTRYIYKLSVYNMAQTAHYNTSYVMYNSDTRMYHIYSSISTMLPGGGGDASCVGMEGGASLPEPTNPIQTRYTSYVTADTYIMNLVIPCAQREYCVLADFIGVIGDDVDFKQCAFNDDSCYYDIDALWNTNDSAETLTGHKMFVLTPTRVYYWDAGTGAVSPNSMYSNNDIIAAMGIISTIQ